MSVSDWLERPVPFPDESLVSWQRRWAQENLLDSRLDLLHSAGCAKAVRMNARDLNSLAKYMGVPLAQVQSLAPQDAPRIPALRKIHTRHFHEGVCPLCLREQQYSRQSWSHALVTACHVHAVKLIAVCEQCREPIAHNRPAAHICKCGANLSEQATSPATAMETEFSALISGQATTDGLLPLALNGNVPADLDLFLIGLVNYFAQDEMGPRGLKRNKSPLPRSVLDANAWQDRLFVLFSNWPHNFEERLKPFLTSELALTASALAAKEGAWFRHVFKRYGHAAYQPIRTCVANSILSSDCGLLSYRSSSIASNASVPYPWVPISEAAKSLGMNTLRLNEGVNCGLIHATVYDCGSSYRQRFLSHTEICRLRQVQFDHCTDTEAISLLAVSPEQFKLLDEAGLIGRSSSLATPPVSRGTVQRASLQALISKLEAAVEGCDKYLAGRVIPFKQLNLKRTTDRQRLFGLYRAIASGELQPVAHDGSSGIGGFLFLRNAVEAKTSSAYVERGLTLEQIKELTSCHYDAVKAWVDMGLLRATQSKSEKGSPWVVDLKDLVQFLMTYTPLSHHASLSDSTSRGITSKLERMGVAPLTSASGRGTLLRMPDLLGALT